MDGDDKKSLILKKMLEAVNVPEKTGTVKVQAAKFILKNSPDIEDQKAVVQSLLTFIENEEAGFSEISQEELCAKQLNVHRACGLLLKYTPTLLKGKEVILQKRSSAMLQRIGTRILGIIDPQERLQAIHELPVIEQGLRDKLLTEFALQEDTPIALRRQAVLSLSSTDSLTEVTQERVENLKRAFLNDKTLSLDERLMFLPQYLEKPLPVEILLSLLDAMNSEEDEENDYNRWRLGLYDHPHPAIQRKLEESYFKRPIAYATYKAEVWLCDFLVRSEESQKTLILQSLREAMQVAKEENDVIIAATFLLKHSQDSKDQEAAIEALLKFVEEQDSSSFEISTEEDSSDSETSEEEEDERKDRSIQVCKILLTHAPASLIKESVLNLSFSKAEEESKPSLLLALFALEDPSVSLKAQQLGEQRIHEENIDYTAKLFFGLQKKNIEPGLRHKIQEKLKPEFMNLADEDVSYLIAEIFVNSANESLSQRAFNVLRNILINEGDDNYEIVDTFIDTFGVDHPWTQDVIKIMIGIEQSDHPNSPYGVHGQLLSSSELADGRHVTFNTETLQIPRSLLNILPLKHSEFMNLVEDLPREVQENSEARAHFSTISSSLTALVNKAGEIYFRSLLDSDEGPGARSLISFKFRRLIADIQALKTQPSTESGLSPASKAVAQFLVNVMACHTNKDDGIDNTSRLLRNESIVSEDDMQEERLIITTREDMREDLRQMRESLLNGEGPIVKHLLFGVEEQQDEKVHEPPHQRKYLSNLLGGTIGTFFDGQSVSYDLDGQNVAEELRSCTRQQALDTLYLYFKPEKVIQHYLEKLNKNTGRGQYRRLINALMDKEMMKDTPEGKKEADEKYSIFDSET